MKGIDYEATIGSLGHLYYKSELSAFAGELTIIVKIHLQDVIPWEIVQVLRVSSFLYDLSSPFCE